MDLSVKSDSNKRNSGNNGGFTLIEFIITVAIVAVLIAGAALYVRTFQSKTDIYSAVLIVAQALHQARGEAIAVNNDSGWGTYVQATSAVVFQGSTYASRTPSFDQYYVLPSNMTATGTLEFDFTKFSATTTAGTTTISTGSSSIPIKVNSQGIVSY